MEVCRQVISVDILEIEQSSTSAAEPQVLVFFFGLKDNHKKGTK
jgi:hypothetical protein